MARFRILDSHRFLRKPILGLIVGILSTHGLLANERDSCGVLVMAHGGTDDWNAAVEDAVSPLKETLPTEIAFGMAAPTTLGQALANLQDSDVQCIAVVRLFMSPHSFRHQTEYLLQLRSDPPPFFIPEHGHEDHQEPDGGEIPDPLPVQSQIRLNSEGLLDAPRMGAVLARRAMSLSDGAGGESVLIVAHGPKDDTENEEWLRKLDALADSVRATASFDTVQVATLREDWDDKRAEAERVIRSFVETKSEDNGRVLVIPFRLFGFGPYNEVLEGLSYEATGTGLLPSPEVAEWIEEQAHQTLQLLNRQGEQAQ